MSNGIRIYVADLSAYNAGILRGEWIDANQDADSIREQIAEMLAGSPEPDAEEWAIHDYEGFEGIKLSEHEDIDTVAELAQAIEEHGEPFAIWWSNESRDGAEVERFEEQYRGEYRSLEDWAEEFLEDTGGLSEVPDSLRNYIDFASWARDAELSGDIWSAEGGRGVYVFDNR